MATRSIAAIRQASAECGDMSYSKILRSIYSRDCQGRIASLLYREHPKTLSDALKILAGSGNPGQKAQNAIANLCEAALERKARLAKIEKDRALKQWEQEQRATAARAQVEAAEVLERPKGSTQVEDYLSSRTAAEFWNQLCRSQIEGRDQLVKELLHLLQDSGLGNLPLNNESASVGMDALYKRIAGRQSTYEADAMMKLACNCVEKLNPPARMVYAPEIDPIFAKLAGHK